MFYNAILFEIANVTSGPAALQFARTVGYIFRKILRLFTKQNNLNAFTVYIIS